MNSDLELTLDTKLVREYFAERYYTKKRLGIILDWDHFSWLNLVGGYFLIDALIYEQNQLSQADYFQIGIRGDLGKHITYSVLADNIQYKELNPGSEIDDNYWILNSDLTLNFTNRLSGKAGLRYNNYNWWNISEHTGVFFNFIWEYRPECNLYCGYKYSADEVNTRYETNYKIYYLKLSHSF
jgi:hypothetical protein